MRARLVAIITPLLTALSVVAGCGRGWSGEIIRFTGEPSFPSAEAWPARIDPSNPPNGAAGLAMTPAHPFRGPADLEVTYLGASGVGQLFEYRHDSLGEGRWFVFRSIRDSGAMVYTLEPSDSDPAKTAFVRVVDARPEYVESVTPLRLLEPTRAGEPRGLIVYHASLGGATEYEWRFLSGLRKRGWRILAVAPENDLMRVFARFTATLDGEAGFRAFAAEMARRADLALAERAYATEAALGWLSERHPEITAGPVVLVGVSAGAIALPATAARLGGRGDRVDAAVLIIGGANLMVMFDRSSMINFRRQIERKATRDLMDLYERTPAWYLEHSTLDPWHTAAALRGTPTLVIHATFDAIVPARTGDELWRRLGRPQRWSLPFGHYGAIWWLPNLSGDVSQWLERVVAAPR